MNLLSNILKVGRGEQFISFTNSDGKRWVMPIRNMRTAMNLYQPSGTKGKLIKRLLPYTYWLPIVKHIVGFQKMKITLHADLERLIRSIFNLSYFEFSIFGGTPSVHQKITLQISNQNAILGYCKLTDNVDIKAIFRHEQSALNTLHKQNITQIPQCLYCGPVVENIDMFAQTTSKSNHSKVLHRFTAKHWDFLLKLHNSTKHNIVFENSDFCRSLILLRGYIGNMSVVQSEILNAALDKIEHTYKNRKVCFSAYHGDFTPWNMFSERGELFVFDFEYVQLSYPPFLDQIHFYTQSAIFVNHSSADDIYDFYLRQGFVSTQESRIHTLCYLLDIVSKYIGRDKGVVTENTSKLIQIWIDLINQIIKDQ